MGLHTFSVTWPGYAGVLTATAPSRFTACINQAPMYRRTQHPWLRLYDLGANGSSYIQRHLAWLRWHTDSDGPVAVHRLYQAGADVPPHPASLAASLRPWSQWVFIHSASPGLATLAY